MLLTKEGQKNFLKTKFHQYFDITLKNNIDIEEDGIKQFVNFTLPLSVIDKYYNIEEIRPFLNSDYNNVIFTPSDCHEIIYDYEFYQGVYFIKMSSFSKRVRMHIIPKKYNASNTGSSNPILFFKDNKQNIDENIFTHSDEYKRANNKKNINLYYQDNIEKVSNGFYKFNIKEHTKNMKNIQINLGYAYNETNPTDKNWHITGIIDESDESGNTIPPEDFSEYNSALVDANSDNRLNYTNKILQQKIKSGEINWEDFYNHDGGFNNDHSTIIVQDEISDIISEHGEVSDIPYSLFRGDCWIIDNNLECSSAIVSSSTEDLTISGTFRTKNDIVSLYWRSKDIITHPYITYGERIDYSDVVLDFDYELNNCRSFDNSDNKIEIKKTNGSVYPLSMSRFIRDNHVKIDFNNLFLLAGSSYINENEEEITVNEATNIDPTDIDLITFKIVPENFVDGGSQYIVTENIDFSCIITNISVSNDFICNEYNPLNSHKYRLYEKYDDILKLNPYRLCREMKKLGYTEWVNLDIGESFFYEKNGIVDSVISPSSSLEEIILNKDVPLNNAFTTWLNCFSRESVLNDFNNIIIGVSMENLQCPTNWRQKDCEGNYAITDTTPHKYTYSPCNNEALLYIKSVSEACLDIVSSKEGGKVILQLNNPLWKYNKTNNVYYPCFYDNSTKQKYIEEFNTDIPEYFGDLNSYDNNVIEWLNNQMVKYSEELRSVVKNSNYEGGLYYTLFSIPDVLGNDIKKMMQDVNYLLGVYNPLHIDNLQIKDYFWITSENENHNEISNIITNLGFKNNEVHYFGGTVQSPEDATKFWPLIKNAIHNAENNGIKEVFICTGTQIRRDNQMIGYDSSLDSFIIADGLYHKTLKYFNDDLYIEEDEKYHIIDWKEIRGD